MNEPAGGNIARWVRALTVARPLRSAGRASTSWFCAQTVLSLRRPPPPWEGASQTHVCTTSSLPPPPCLPPEHRATSSAAHVSTRHRQNNADWHQHGRICWGGSWTGASPRQQLAPWGKLPAEEPLRLHLQRALAGPHLPAIPHDPRTQHRPRLSKNLEASRVLALPVTLI